AAAEQAIADRAAREHADHRAGADDEEYERPEHVRDPVLLRHELDAEGLGVREEVVAARARDDEDDVRPDAEDVARRRAQAHAARVARQDELWVRLDAVLASDPLRVGLVRLVARRLLDRRRGVHEWAAPAALRLREAQLHA